MNNLLFNEIAIFIKVIELGSFVKASENLGIPTTTVSRKISELENNLGICLIHRSTRKIKLTDKGKEYFDLCSNAINNLYSANQIISNSNINPAGNIKVSASIEFGEEILTDWVIKFKKKYPNINIEIILDNKYLDFFDNNIDISFRAGKIGDSPNFKMRKIISIPYILCSTKKYLSNYSINKIDDLKNHNCISISSYNNPVKWTFYDNNNQILEFKLENSNIKTNNLTVAKKMLLSGFGIAYLPYFIIKDNLDNNEIIPLLEYLKPIKRDVYAIYHSSKQTIYNIRLFLDFIVALG